MDEIKGLDEFVDEVSTSGVVKFVVHARKALLNGLSPKQNREIPPLNYERVASLKRRRPDLEIILNGGIETLNQGKALINEHYLDGFMIGREAYKNPYILSSVDQEIFEKKTIIKTRYQIVIEMANYIDKCIKKDETRMPAITRHMLGLYNGLPGAKEWRRTLSEDIRSANNSDILKFATDKIEEVIQSKNVA
jgi:tRNA-dihydrouridine synthase A